MIYLKDNKINKFGNNKIYLGDKLIYQTVKGKEEPITQPTYLKSAFAYDSFAEDGITDVITNTKYDWYISKYTDFNFTINDHYNTIYQNSSYKSLQTYVTKEPILKDFKSILIKCGNVLTNTFYSFIYSQGPLSNFDSIEIGNSFLKYITDNYFYSDYEFEKNEVMYIYVDFNGGSEQSKFLFLNENFEILAQYTFNTFNLSTNQDVGFFNSLLYISFGTYNNSEKPIDFYYQCYCDKFLSISEIKEIDKYMMQR